MLCCVCCWLVGGFGSGGPAGETAFTSLVPSECVQRAMACIVAPLCAMQSRHRTFLANQGEEKKLRWTPHMKMMRNIMAGRGSTLGQPLPGPCHAHADREIDGEMLPLFPHRIVQVQASG